MATPTGMAPRVERIIGTVPTTTILQTATGIISRAPYDGTVTQVRYLPNGAVTGAASPASRSLTLVNKGQAGLGTTVIATLALLGTINEVAFDEIAFPLSAVALAVDVTEGDVLAVVSTPVGGTGLVETGGILVVELTRS